MSELDDRVSFIDSRGAVRVGRILELRPNGYLLAPETPEPVAKAGQPPPRRNVVVTNLLRGTAGTSRRPLGGEGAVYVEA